MYLAPPPEGFQPQRTLPVGKPRTSTRLEVPDKGTYGTVQHTFNQNMQHVDVYAAQVSQTEYGSFRDLIWALVYARNLNDDLEKVR